MNPSLNLTTTRHPKNTIKGRQSLTTTRQKTILQRGSLGGRGGIRHRKWVAGWADGAGSSCFSFVAVLFLMSVCIMFGTYKRMDVNCGLICVL